MIEDYAPVLPKHSPTNVSTSSARRFRARRNSVLAGSVAYRHRQRLLGDDVGQIYAQKYFPPEAKAQAQAMVANIIAAFRKRIDALSWMDSRYQGRSSGQADHLYVGIGYPGNVA